MRNGGSAAVALAALAVVAIAVAGGQAGLARSTAGPTNTTPPTIAGTARQGETLTASSGSWTGTGTITFAYAWQRCGSTCAPIAGATGQTYVVAAADVGAQLAVEVTAKDTAGSSTASSDRTAAVAAANAPVNTSAPTVSGTARAGQTLTASTGRWSGTTPIGYRFQWRRCSTAGASCADVSGATAQSYRLAAADVGHTMRVDVTASNAAGASEALSSPTAVVAAGGSAPANSRAPSLSGSAVVGKTLTLNVGSWTGTSPIAFSYGWTRCDARGGSCSQLAADGNSYVLRREDAGHTVRGVVTASNADGRSSAVTAQSALVQGVAFVTAAPTISGTAAQGRTLTASPGTWVSATKLTLSYQWLRCDAAGKGCAPIAGATSSKYAVTSADAGRRLLVQVKGHNAYGDAFASSAPTGVVGGAASNALPVGGISLPERLVVDRVGFSPSRITSHAKPLTLRAHVTTTGGRPVQGALVYVVGVPYDRLSKAKEVATDGNGWATVVFDVKPSLRIRRGNLMVLFVRARKPGGDLLAGISTRRLVSVRVG